MTLSRVPFSDVVRDVSAGNVKIAQSDFLSSGRLAVVDQGKSLVAGFTDEVGAAVRTVGPLIVFGDHTRALKFVDFPFAMGADGTKVLQVRDGVHPRYVYWYLHSLQIPSAGYSRHFKFLKEVTVPVPSMGDQRRIAAILDHADALRAKRRQVLAHLDVLTQSIFHDMFGEKAWPIVPLADLAAVTSGITKGRKTSDPVAPVPYLAVSNVQAGHLKLDVVKSIDATTREIERFALRDGDLVLTEGGDPDKLGRGTVWRDELPLCLHQNHIFRVRPPAHGRVRSEYLAAYLASRPARSYFLQAAKQTTGIASINMTQLKALPVGVPPMESQAVFLSRNEVVGAQQRDVERSLVAEDELFAALQSRAFKGEL